jgi:hypothetical protein
MANKNIDSFVQSDENESFARHPKAEADSKNKSKFSVSKAINQSYATVTHKQSNSFLMHSKSIKILSDHSQNLS